MPVRFCWRREAQTFAFFCSSNYRRSCTQGLHLQLVQGSQVIWRRRRQDFLDWPNAPEANLARSLHGGGGVVGGWVGGVGTLPLQHKMVPSC